MKNIIMKRTKKSMLSVSAVPLSRLATCLLNCKRALSEIRTQNRGSRLVICQCQGHLGLLNLIFSSPRWEPSLCPRAALGRVLSEFVLPQVNGPKKHQRNLLKFRFVGSTPRDSDWGGPRWGLVTSILNKPPRCLWNTGLFIAFALAFLPLLP